MIVRPDSSLDVPPQNTKLVKGSFAWSLLTEEEFEDKSEDGSCVVSQNFID